MGVVPAGRLNRRVLIQCRLPSQNSYGQQSEEWGDLITVWADIRYPSGISAINNQFQAGGIEVSQVACSIRIRKRDEVDASMRIVYKGRYYDIRSVQPDEAGNEYMDLICTVGANRG